MNNKTQNTKKRLYVFDFDETLVFDNATIYVIEPNGNKKRFTSFQFHDYELKPGEKVDVNDFSRLNNPKPNYKMLTLLEKHLDESVILSARQSATPIIEFTNSIGLEVPEVIVVGEALPKKNTSQQNAERKREWIQKQLEKGGLEYVEFWDDSVKNINEVNKLKALYPNVKIITHLVR